ncbi:MAG: nucleoside triphosphate pyrophosphohydrolase [Caldisericaceae bacterium]
MQEWIIENDFSVSDKAENAFSIVRALISLDEGVGVNAFKRTDLEVRSIPLKGYESERTLIIYTDFLNRVGFPFALVSSCNKSLFTASAMLLIHRGFSLEEAVGLAKSKTDYTPESLDKRELIGYEKYAVLFDLNKEAKKIYEITELVRLLRNECPWDREQTHQSLVPELIEESLELSEEIKRQNNKGIEEELGDTLLQIIFHTVLGEEDGAFDISGVTDVLFEKLFVRHPHVFGKSKVDESRQVLDQWENIKKAKHKQKGINISKILSSFITTVDSQEFARIEGFDFSNVNQIQEKISEELEETREALAKNTNVREEVGDLLFSVINLARFLEIDPSHALFLSMNKFEKRFAEMKKRFPKIKDLNEAQADKLWREIKKDEEPREHR